MNILTLSPDGRDLRTPDSPAAQRFIKYGSRTKRFDAVVPGAITATTQLAENVTIFSVQALGKAAYLFSCIRAVSRLMRHTRYDIFSTRDTYYLGIITLALARYHRIGLEIQVHGFEKLAGIRRLLAGWLLRNADSVRVVSMRLKQKLTNEFDVPANRITVCPIFIDHERIQNEQSQHPLSLEPHHPFTFITVGRCVPVKNVALQIRALQSVNRQYPARLIIVGDGPLRAHLENVALREQVDHLVLFCGAQREISPYFAMADCFLLTSNEEGYGLAPIEAACAGLPVIMTDVGCAGEVLKPEENALIIPPNNEQALVAAMCRMIADQDTRQFIRKQQTTIGNRLLSLEATLDLYQESWERASLASKTTT